MAKNKKISTVKLRNIKKYSQEDLQKALQAVKNGMSFKCAAETFHIPRITLMYKFKGKSPLIATFGPPTTLTKDEEKLIVSWLFYIANAGFPATKQQLIESVELLCKNLNRNTKFTNGKPGKKWYNSFLKRHPEIASRVSQNLTSSRSSVTEKNIRDWFEEIVNYCKKNNYLEIFEDPRRVFNADESAFFLCPKQGKVLVKRGEKTVYNFVSNDEKECLTALVTANAAGMLVPPMVIYKYERIPHTISSLMPENWGIGRSESGNYNWILRNNIPLPVVLFVDGHRSHLTMHLSDFCKEKGIILIALFPNATHILQPMDVAVFHPLKNGWKNEVYKWRTDNEGNKLKRDNFSRVLKLALDKYIPAETIINGFNRCGLCPLNVNAIEFSKYFKNTGSLDIVSPLNGVSKDMLKLHLNFIEKRLPSEKLDEFKKSGNEWKGNTEDSTLFQFWNSLVRDICSYETSNEIPATVTTKEKTPIKKIHILQNVIITQERIVGLDKNAENLRSTNSESVVNLRQDDTSFSVSDSQYTSRPTSPTNKQRTPIKALSFTEQITPAKQIVPERKVLNNLNNIIPTPFKRSFFWPEISGKEKDTKRKRKEKIPSVATSEQWRQYHKKREEEKLKKEQEIMERKKLRDAKRAEKEKAKKIKRKLLKDEWSSSDSSYDESCHTDTEQEIENEPVVTQDVNYTVGDHVIFIYENKYFPGLIKDISNNVYFINAMAPSGLNWRWPSVEDYFGYTISEIIQKIKPPRAINTRGSYIIPEISKYVN